MPASLAPDLTAPLTEWAQWYAAYGLPVIPMHTPQAGGCSCVKGAACLHPGKHPRTLHGRNDASTNRQTIITWWQQWPDANIAIKTDGLFVLDTDPRHYGQDSLRRLEAQYGELPDCPRVISGSGGDHYYFALPADGIAVYSSDGVIAPGVDIKGFNGNINVPPSAHPSGQPYCWDALFSLDAFDLTPPPPWLVDLARQARPTGSQAYQPGVSIPEGARYHYLISIASRFRLSGFTEPQIYDALCIANQNCQPPEADNELRAYAKWAARKDTADPYTLNPATLIVPPHLSGNGGTPAAGQGPPGSPAQQWGTPRAKLQLTDLADMLERTYPAPRWLIKDLIPEGLTFFVGSPKSSKTYLAYSLALSLAYEAQRGGQWLNHYEVVNPGPVVYLTLEDDEADSWWRIAELAPWLKTIERDRFLFVHGFELPRFHEGLIDALQEDIIATHHPSLIVLDPISYLYTTPKKGSDQFGEVKDMLLPLRWLGKEHHCSILGVDHRRKKSTEDVDIFETTYGSNAKIAVADSILMIVREDKEVTVHARVRKAEDQTLTLLFGFAADGTARWTWKGSTVGLLQTGNYGDLRVKTLSALSGSSMPMSVEDLLFALNIPLSQQTRNAMKQVLWRAVKAQEVQKTNRVHYVWAAGH